jgi:hypothetical protein
MKKSLIVFLFVTMCGFSAAFGQLRVSNNYGQDLKITINGEENVVPYKGIKIFGVRGEKNIVLECATLDGKNKFSMPREVNRSGMVTVDPVENRLDRGQSSQISTVVETPVNQSGGQLAALLQGGKQTTTPTIVNKENNAGSSVSVNSVTTTSNQTNIVQQSQAGFEKIKVVYTGVERFKVFSDLGGGQWQGIEFRGKSKADSIGDNSKNEYDLYIQKNRDIHVGVVFNPEKSINEYGEFRKRVNAGDNVLYINQGDIKKMSTSERKAIKIKFMAKNFKLFFDPEDESKDGKSTAISINYEETSRKFMAPVGQFYLKASCTNLATGMFYPTIYIPIHIGNSDSSFEVTTEQINRLVNGADLNLKWSNIK